MDANVVGAGGEKGEWKEMGMETLEDLGHTGVQSTAQNFISREAW